MQLDRELAPRVEHRVAARLEHAIEAAVAHEEGALAILHGHAQNKQMPRHGTSPSLAVPYGDGLSFRFEDMSPGRDFPCDKRAAASVRASGGRAHPCAALAHGGRMANPTIARAVSAAAQSRCYGVEVRARSLSAKRPDRD
jgi:hypothetical protein